MQKKQSMKTIVIVAIDEHRGIGINGKTPWYLPADLKHFSDSTKGHVVICGRKTYESFPVKFQPLPERVNVILSKQKGYFPQYFDDNTDVCSSYEEAIALATRVAPEKDIYIIGGGEIYQYALSHDSIPVHRVIVTEVAGTFEADTFFPELNPLDWRERMATRHAADERNKYAFVIKQFDRFMASI
jgi:dihydrofolate reductase